MDVNLSHRNALQPASGCWELLVILLKALSEHYCHHEKWFGHAPHAVVEKKYLIRLDNGEEKELPSMVLKVEYIFASLPLDIPLLTPQKAQEKAVLENALEELAYTDEMEDMPVVSPESEEVEEQEAEAEEMEKQMEIEELDTNERMPGLWPSV